MSWRVSSHYGITPDSNAPKIPRDPTLVLESYLAGGSGTETFLLTRPLKHRVPRSWWLTTEDPGPIYLAVEISDMSEITGEEVEAFKGFPWNVCFYAACAGFQSEGFWDELRSNGCKPPWEPWFVSDAMHDGHSAPVFQLDADTEEVAKEAAQMVVPWVEKNFMQLMRVPINKIGSHGFDWLRGELVSRPGLQNMGGSGRRTFN